MEEGGEGGVVQPLLTEEKEAESDLTSTEGEVHGDGGEEKGDEGKPDYRLNFSPVEGCLGTVPEHSLLTQIELTVLGVEQSSGASETVETHSESNSTAVSASIGSRTGGHFSSQFTKAEPLTAKQQVALWLTRTSAQDIQQEFSVSVRSLVTPSTSNAASKYKKSKVPSSTTMGAGRKRADIQRNLSTKSLMERFTSSTTEPSYSPIRKCETVLALSSGPGSEVMTHTQTGQGIGCRGHAQALVHRRRKPGEGSSRVSLFKRLSKCSSMAGPRLGTAPGDLGSVTSRGDGESPHPFPGLRPVNRLRSKSSILQCSRCTSVMSVATSRMTSRATSQMSLLLDKRHGRVPREDDVMCKICLFECPCSAMITIEECGCSFCGDCMQQYITFEVMEGAYDISCPDPECSTQSVLNQHQMERLTDKELLDKHRTFRLNTEVSMDAARTFCPSAGCDTICHICVGTKAHGVPVSCPTCDKEFCSLCSATWHPALSCAENGAALVKRGVDTADPFSWPDLGDDNIKRCPMCSVPIERDAGCAQMMCKRCKHVFCWYCLSSLDDDFLLRHYDSGECQGKLGHSRASVIWHRAQVIGIFAGFGILLLVASPVLLMAAPCIICCKCRFVRLLLQK